MTRRNAIGSSTVIRGIFTPNLTTVSWVSGVRGGSSCSTRWSAQSNFLQRKDGCATRILMDSQGCCSLLLATPHLIISQILGLEAPNTSHVAYAETLCHARMAPGGVFVSFRQHPLASSGRWPLSCGRIVLRKDREEDHVMTCDVRLRRVIAGRSWTDISRRMYVQDQQARA